MRQFVGFGRFASIRAIQIREELLTLVEKVDEIDPDCVVEIGSYQGGTLYMWSRLLDAERIVSIDLPEDELHHTGYNPRLFQAFSHTAEMRFVRGFSQNDETKEVVEDMLESEPIDFLFIDGDHSYEGVKADFEQYEPLVRDGGLIALHDIAYDSDGNGVPQFWDEITTEYETESIVVDNPDDWDYPLGIGLVRV